MIRFVATFLFGVIMAGKISAQYSAEKRLAHFNVNENGVALQGYDPVIYFTIGEPHKGNKEISHTYKGVTYYFMSLNNRDLFKLDPGKYEPRYGGWDAFQMAKQGEKQTVDLDIYTILDGKLYLFQNTLFRNNLKRWKRSEKELRDKADANWAAIMEQ